MTKQDLLQTINYSLEKDDLSSFTKDDYRFLHYDACSNNPNFDDEHNPVFILNGLPISLLALIAEGKINLQDLAKHTLASSGYDTDGKWVGFKK